ncbi:MAG: class I SAM-dependent methyltransferase [Euryarchaeota archaeon]|nr:class I SAM-dependent methyltransferase [Euryarchaeota archaeon]
MPHKFSPASIAKLEDSRRFYPISPREILGAVGLTEGMQVADVGCGVGVFAIPAALLVGGDGIVYAIDPQEEMLSILRDRASAAGAGNIRPLRSSEEHIPIPDGTLDLVLMVDVLHELEGDGTLREVRRILRTGGTLVVIDWRMEGREDMGPPREERVPEGEVRRRLSSLGFGDVRRVKAGEEHYALLFRRRS